MLEPHLGDTLTLTATHKLVRSDRFDLAVAPQATFFLPEGSGARLGGLAIGGYDDGDHAVSGTFRLEPRPRAAAPSITRCCSASTGAGFASVDAQKDVPYRRTLRAVVTRDG